MSSFCYLGLGKVCVALQCISISHAEFFRHFVLLLLPCPRLYTLRNVTSYHSLVVSITVNLQ